MRCRHYGTWLIAAGSYEWCWRCGAFRMMEHIGPASVTPAGAWARPVGPDGENPWDALRKANEAWSKRQAKRRAKR
jgi:hypothetical protein